MTGKLKGIIAPVSLGSEVKVPTRVDLLLVGEVQYRCAGHLLSR